MADIPTTLIIEILSRLPVKSLLRFCCVAKSWLSIIKDPYFIKLHLKQSIQDRTNQVLILRDCEIHSVDFPTLKQATTLDHPLVSDSFGTEVLGSCNGLLCLWNGEAEEEGVQGTVVYNPATRKHHALPVSPVQNPEYFTYWERLIYGFGYDHVNDDHKLVRIIQFSGSDYDYHDSEVKVYSLKLGSWARIKDFPREYFLSYKRAYGFHVNGCLHWVVTRKPESDGSKLIMSLDLSSEEYKIISLPKDLDGEFHLNAGVLRGCLYVICNYYDVQSEVWIMEEYGVEESWTKLFSIAQKTVLGSFEYVRPIAFSNDGSSLLLDQDCNKLIWFDLERKRAEKVKVRGMPSSFEAEMLVESLVPLPIRVLKKEEKLEKKKKQKPKKKRDEMDGFLATGFKLKF